MSTISGRSGIAVDLELRINTDANFNPLGDASFNNTNFNYCSGAANDCRLAFLFHNRNSGGGEWIVWKDFYGTLKADDVWLDAGQGGAVPSPYPDDVEKNRFMDGAGSTCLLDVSLSAEDCHRGAFNQPMMQLSFHSDLELLLNIGAVAVEYGATGYENDASIPALGVLIADTGGGVDNGLTYDNVQPARIKIGGSIGLYGF
jgi:hypothetical protein